MTPGRACRNSLIYRAVGGRVSGLQITPQSHIKRPKYLLLMSGHQPLRSSRMHIAVSSELYLLYEKERFRSPLAYRFIKVD